MLLAHASWHCFALRRYRSPIGAFSLLHGLALNAFGNLPADIARYLLADIGITAFVIGGCQMLFWRRDQGGPHQALSIESVRRKVQPSVA